MNERRSYIGNATAGISEDIFAPDFQGGTTKGLSGTSIAVDVRPNFVYLHAEGEGHDLFLASVDTEGTLSLAIKNRETPDADPINPDLFPAQLVDRSITHFQEHGFSVQRIQATWRTPSLNRAQYFARLRDHSEGLETNEVKTAAALATWEGSLAMRHGFGKAEIQSEDGPVKVLFTKPVKTH